MRVSSVILAVCLLCNGMARAQQPAAAPNAPSAEAVQTEEGSYLVRHWAPASAADLDMPLFTPGTVKESFAYRVGDRKQHDLLHYARVSLSSTHSPAGVVAFYRAALGEHVAMKTTKGTGEVALAAGVRDNLRLVTVTPDERGCRIRLERVQRFTVPARVYTAPERRVLRVLESVAQTYRNARHVVFTEKQRVFDSASPHSDTQTWHVDFRRPQDVHLTVTAAANTVLTITTRKHQLVVSAPGAKDKLRTFGDNITLDQLPELQDDPLARLVLGETLIVKSVDTLVLNNVAGVPANRQVEVVLSYPESASTLRLLLDLRRKMLLRSELLVTQDHTRQRIVRTYQQLPLESSTPPGHHATATQPDRPAANAP